MEPSLSALMTFLKTGGHRRLESKATLLSMTMCRDYRGSCVGRPSPHTRLPLWAQRLWQGEDVFLHCCGRSPEPGSLTASLDNASQCPSKFWGCAAGSSSELSVRCLDYAIICAYMVCRGSLCGVCHLYFFSVPLFSIFTL